MPSALGITGHREPSWPAQADTLRNFLVAHPRYTVLHHGACVGIDHMSHYVGLFARRHIVVHPPTDKRYFASDTVEHPYRHGLNVIVLPDKRYDVRNLEIVEDVDFLLGFPLYPEDHEKSQRSGTWQTIRMARRKKVPYLVINPDGTFYDDPKATQI